MSDNWALGSVIPPHLWSPQFGSHGLLHNWIYFSIQYDEFSVPTSVTSSMVNKILDAALDDKDIQESVTRTNTASNPLQLQRYAMNERENKQRGQRSKTPNSDSESSIYRGVIKFCEDRFEAFVWDTTNSEGRGRIVYIGGYATEIEAARAHDVVSVKLYGESTTTTNFPVSCYGMEIREMQEMSKKEYIEAIRRKGKGFIGKDCPYRGVYRIIEGRKWEAWLGDQDSGLPRIFLGRYYTAEDAARAYDIALIKFKGMEAITNFDLSTYEVEGIMKATKPPTVKTFSKMNQVLLQRGSSEVSSSSFLLQQPLTQPLSNTSSSLHGYLQNPNQIQSSPYSFGRFTGTGSGIGTSDNSVGNFGATFPNKGPNVEQPLTQQLNNPSSSLHGYQKNPNVIQSSPNSYGGLTGTGSGLGTSYNSVGTYDASATFANKGTANAEQPLITRQLNNSLSSFHGYQNPNYIQSNPYSFGGLTGTGSGIGIGDNSAGNYGTTFPNKGAYVEQPLISQQLSNSSSSFHGYQNHNPIQSNTYSFGGLNGTGSMVGTSENPVRYYSAMLLGTSQDFQAPEAQQNQLNVNINNEFNHNPLNNQQLLPYDFGSQSLGGSDMGAFSNAVNLKSPMTHMVNKTPGEANGGTSQELHSQGFYQVQPYDQNFEPTQQVPMLNNQSSEPHSYNPNHLNHVPNQNSNSSFFSSFLNICSGTNTGSLSQMMESLDDSGLIQYVNSSDGGFQKPYSESKTSSQSGLITEGQYVNNSSNTFQNPSSETNTGSQSLMMTESQGNLDSSQHLNISHDKSSYYIPCLETNTGSQSLMNGNPDDLDMSKYLSGSYIMEGTYWFGDLDIFWATDMDNGL